MANQLLNDNVVGSCLGEEEPRINFRAQRYYKVGHNWFFKTREGDDHGPYFSRAKVIMKVEAYVEKMKNM